MKRLECWCCRISVHVPTSFCCRGLQPVYTARTSTTDLERNSCRQVGSRLVKMSHIFVTAFSVVSCCVMSSTCSFLSHPFFCVAEGKYLDFVTCAHGVLCENTPSWHGQCLSCKVIASAAISLLCWLPLLRSGYLIFY